MFKSPWVPPSPVIARTPGSRCATLCCKCVCQKASPWILYTRTPNQKAIVCANHAHGHATCVLRANDQLVQAFAESLSVAVYRNWRGPPPGMPTSPWNHCCKRAAVQVAKKKTVRLLMAFHHVLSPRRGEKATRNGAQVYEQGVAGELCSVSHRVRWESKVGYFKGVTKNRINKNIWIFQSL